MSRTSMRLLTAIALLLLPGCSSSPLRDSAPGPSRQTVRLKLPPNDTAACFARNAEEHSSALIAEVRRRGDRAEVVVRVRNGVFYASAEFQRAASGSTAALTLNVITK